MPRLIIVDDHVALRDGLEMMLNRSGVEVAGVAGNVAAALDLIDVCEPTVALVDIHLPDGSGIALTRELLSRRPGLGVLLYTGDTDAELFYEGLDSGARGYALKTGSFEELRTAIDQVADGGSYVDPRLDRALLSSRTGPRAPQLSPREREIMHLLAEGRTGEEIGAEITVSVETVRTHVRNVVRKLGARNRVHAIALALERGEISLSDGD